MTTRALAVEGLDTNPCKYSTEYAAALPHLLVVSARGGENIGHRYPVVSAGVVGRGAEVLVRFDDETVSRQHCVVEQIEGGGGRHYRVVDLGSANGTWVNGRRVSTHALAHGDLVQVGRFSCVRFHAGVASEVRRASAQDLAEAAQHDEPVCLIGPTGSGKTHSAMLIHAMSPRKRGPFIHLNAADLSGDPNAMKSKLVGHRRGAFTGATDHHVGALYQADGGTLYLDELESASADAQAQLLTLLDRNPSPTAYAPLNGSPPTRVPSSRLIVSMKRSPFQTALRDDLVHRVTADLMWLPSLAETPERIDGLAQGFVAAAAKRAGTQAELTDEALVALRKERWPGNVRELESVLTTLVARLSASRRLANRHGSRVQIDGATVQQYLSLREYAVDTDAEVSARRRFALESPPASHEQPPAAKTRSFPLVVSCGELASRREREHASWEELGRLAKVSAHTARAMAAAGRLQSVQLERVPSMEPAALKRFASEHRTAVKHVLARLRELGMVSGARG